MCLTIPGLFVDTRAAALKEPGDIIIPVRLGPISFHAKNAKNGGFRTGNKEFHTKNDEFSSLSANFGFFPSGLPQLSHVLAQVLVANGSCKTARSQRTMLLESCAPKHNV